MQDEIQSRTSLLLGEDGLDRLRRSRVAVFGVGGVGGYAAEALAVHGFLKGVFLAAKRIGKCAPWHPGGYDPVPPRHEKGGAYISEDGDR